MMPHIAHPQFLNDLKLNFRLRCKTCDEAVTNRCVRTEEFSIPRKDASFFLV